MAFTAANLASVEAAILALASGERVATVDLNGERIEYNQTNLRQLLALRDAIRDDINTTAATAAGTTRYRYAVTDKGY